MNIALFMEVGNMVWLLRQEREVESRSPTSWGIAPDTKLLGKAGSAVMAF